MEPDTDTLTPPLLRITMFWTLNGGKFFTAYWLSPWLCVSSPRSVFSNWETWMNVWASWCTRIGPDPACRGRILTPHVICPVRSVSSLAAISHIGSADAGSSSILSIEPKSKTFYCTWSLSIPIVGELSGSWDLSGSLQQWGYRHML